MFDVFEVKYNLANGEQISGAVIRKKPEYPIATITGLGNSSLTTVTFDVPTEFDALLNFEEVTDANNNIFVKIPKFYRKILDVTNNQIISIAVSNGKIDNGYQPYPCFVKEDGVTEMDYILIGKYMISSTSIANSVNATPVNMNISNFRTRARALGDGYQLFDWQMWKLIQDLIMLKLKSVNTNDGSGFTSILGIEHQNNNLFWVDGISKYSTNWVFSYKPSKYIDSPTTASTDYFTASYTASTNSGNITKLGYDVNHPFVNQVNTASGSSYNTYYCDVYTYTMGQHAASTWFGGSRSEYGVFALFNDSFYSQRYARLCYRPIN